MKIRRNIVSVASVLAVAAMAAPSVVRAEPVAMTRSVVEVAHVTSGESGQQDVFAKARLMGVVRAKHQIHKVTFNRQVGVELFVPAEPGMTAAWIAREADRHAAALLAAGDTSSPLAVEGVRADVKEVRTGYLVRITAKDKESAAEVIRRAERTYTR